jgi:cell division protein FtsB
LAGLPVNYNYWFNTDGSVAEDVLEQSVDIQDQIAEIDKIKQPTEEDKAQKKALKT